MAGRWGRQRVCAFVLVVSALAAPARAQLGAGAVSGKVVDESGVAVPGAMLTATDMATSLTRTAVTGSDGGYSIPGLRPGVYRVRIALSGFRTVIRDGVRIATGDTVTLDLQLQLGGLSEAVTVTADASLLRSAAAGLGQVIDNRKVVDLPLNGRSFIALAGLAPGVAVPPPPAAPLPRINGGRPRTNEYLFDGISVLQPEPGPGRVLPQHRRDSGIQDREQQSARPSSAASTAASST